MYDLIGDIHGYAAPLQDLLVKLDYQQFDGIWQHPSRQVVFLGDFIDRGPEQVETVRIARTMVEHGKALAVMGNHEFNAVAWATHFPERPTAPMRVHSAKNRAQHREFLAQVVEHSVLHQQMIAWFKTLPVYLDLPGFRVVHACWHPRSLEIIASYTDPHQRILDQAWPALCTQGTEPCEALEILLKGLEVRLPNGLEYIDRQGIKRRDVRLKWWQLKDITYRDLADLSPADIESLPHDPVPENVLPGYAGDKPLFVGHYWRTGDPAPLNDHIACLDYSIAARGLDVREMGKLCAYRWNGEKHLSKDGFVWVT